MRYFRRRWDEPRADAFHVWGLPTVWLEVDPDRRIVRQLEQYENGTEISYDGELRADRFGGISDVPIRDAEFDGYEIPALEFERAWTRAKPMNRRQP